MSRPDGLEPLHLFNMGILYFRPFTIVPAAWFLQVLHGGISEVQYGISLNLDLLVVFRPHIVQCDACLAFKLFHPLSLLIELLLYDIRIASTMTSAWAVWRRGMWLCRGWLCLFFQCFDLR